VYQAPGSVLSAADAPYPPQSGNYAWYITAQEGVGTQFAISMRVNNIPVPAGGVIYCTVQLYINPSNPASVVKYNPRLYLTNSQVAGNKEQGNLSIASTNGKWMTLGGLVTIPAGQTSTFAALQIAKSTSGKVGDFAVIGVDNLVCYPVDGSQCAGTSVP
jgi:hypothetical protein